MRVWEIRISLFLPLQKPEEMELDELKIFIQADNAPLQDVTSTDPAIEQLQNQLADLSCNTEGEGSD